MKVTNDSRVSLNSIAWPIVIFKIMFIFIQLSARTAFWHSSPNWHVDSEFEFLDVAYKLDIECIFNTFLVEHGGRESFIKQQYAIIMFGIQYFIHYHARL